MVAVRNNYIYGGPESFVDDIPVSTPQPELRQVGDTVLNPEDLRAVAAQRRESMLASAGQSLQQEAAQIEQQKQQQSFVSR